MSARATFWAWAQKIPQGQKIVLLAIADSANDDGQCWPGYGELKKKTGIKSDASIARHIKELEKAGLLRVENRYTSIKGEHKRISNLYHLPLTVTSNFEETVTSKNEVTISSKNEVTISSNFEEESNNESNNESKRSDAYLKFAEFMWEKIQPITKSKPPNLGRWADDIRKIVEIDGRTENEVVTVFEWANRDDFWQSNILSPKKLRDKFGQLYAQMNRKRGGKHGRHNDLADDLTDTSWAH